MTKMLVIQDTREQHGLFDEKDCHIAKLDTGDYSVASIEKIKYTDNDLNHLLCIERKATATELFSNVTQERFKKCIERMEKFKYKFLLCEFSFDDILSYPYGSKIPKRRWRYLKVKSPFVISCLTRYQVEYGIHVIYAGDHDNAKYIAKSIMERVWKI